MLRSFAVCLPLLLGACSLAAPIARQAIDYNNAVETAANTLLVRNVLRARDNAPLHFTTIPQIRGSLSFGLTQPGAFGPAGANAQSGAGLGLQALSSPSFDVAALDTQEFTRGLLDPIAPQLFRYFAERGVSEQLLALLLLETVVDDATGQRIPNDPRCWFGQADCPQHFNPEQVARAFLTTTGEGRYFFHQVTVLTPVGPPLDAATARNPTLLGSLEERKLRLLPAGRGWQLYRVEPREAACRRPGRPGIAGCAAGELVETAHSAGGGARGGPGVQVQLRSVGEIYRFLGAVVRAQDAAGGRCLAFPVRPGAPAEEACLFRVTRNAQESLPGGVAFTVEHGGETWRVPAYAEPAPGRQGDYTLRVMGLMTDLLNLQKTSTAIPSTRAVQLVR